MQWPPPELPAAKRGLRTALLGGQTYVHVTDLTEWMRLVVREEGSPPVVVEAIDLLSAELVRVGNVVVEKRKRITGGDGNNRPPDEESS